MKEQKVNWNLDHILSRSKFEPQREKLQKQLATFKNNLKKLDPRMKTEVFAALINESEQLNSELSRLYNMPALSETVDQQDSEVKRMKELAKDLLIEVEDVSRNLSHWIKGKMVASLKILDDKNAVRLFSAVPGMQYQLTRSRSLAKHSLSEPEERIISRKDATGISVITDLRSVLETEQTFSFKPKGTKPRIIKTEAELRRYTFSPKASEREAAYKALLGTYKDNLQKYFLIYQAVVKDWNNEAKLRNYTSAISVRNTANDIEDKTVETLVSVVEANTPLFHKFFKLKAKALNQKKLRRFDIYAPTGSIDKTIGYQDAVKSVLAVFDSFNSSFHAKARQIIDEKHIDSHPSPVKQSGAFCATVSPEITPYVMLNFSGRFRDVSTLAHELGHGIHSVYANKQSYSTQSAPLPLAETASTLAEMILFEHELEELPKTDQAKLLFEKLSDIYATVIRQVYFLKFELEAHNAITEGTTPEGLSDIYYKNLQTQFGNAVQLSAEFRYEWAYIPHFVHTPFYVYAYAFGELLALALYSLYKQTGKPFVSKIETILAAGGSQNPKQLLKDAGFDISSPKFWNSGFEIVSRYLSILTGMVD